MSSKLVCLSLRSGVCVFIKCHAKILVLLRIVEENTVQFSKADDNEFATENLLITDAKKISIEMIQLTD